MNRRSLFLGIALAATVAASIWAGLVPERDSGVAARGSRVDGARPDGARANRDNRGADRDELGSRLDPAVAARVAAKAASAPDGDAGADAGLPQAAGELTSLAIAARPAAVRKPRDLFAAYSWVPPPAPPPKIVPVVEAPRAPPLPFTYSGRVIVDDAPSYLLLEGNRMHIVKPGTQIGEFRFESASPSNLVFVHVPTSLEVLLPANIPGSVGANAGMSGFAPPGPAVLDADRGRRRGSPAGPDGAIE